MLAKRTSKNQITIPKRVMEGFPSVDYFDVRRKGGAILLTPVSVSVKEDRLSELRAKMSKLGISESDVEKAIHWARKAQ